MADLRAAWRMLRKHPTFTLIAILTLGLGIGANVVIFSLIDALELHKFPGFTEPERVVWLFESTGDSDESDVVEAANFADWKRQTHTLSQLAGMTTTGFTITGGGEPESVLGY